MKLDKYLVLSWKRVLTMAGVWVLSVLLHKAIYTRLYDYLLTEVSLAATALFILGTIVIPLYCLISIVYTLIRKLGYDQFLLLSRRTWLTIAAWVLAWLLNVLIHGAFYESYSRAGLNDALWLISKGVINLPGYVVTLYLVVSIVYTAVTKAPRDRRGIVAVTATILALLSVLGALAWDSFLLALASLSYTDAGEPLYSETGLYASLLAPWGIVAILVILVILAFKWARRPQHGGG